MTHGASGRLLILHGTVPATRAPEPRDRHVARRALGLAAAFRGEVVLLAAEPQLGNAAYDELRAAGIRVVTPTAALDAALRQEGADASAVIATDLVLAARAQRALPDVPCVVDLASVPSFERVRTCPDDDDPERPGFDTVLARAQEIDGVVLRGARVVLCCDEPVASAVRAAWPDVPVRVLPPPVPLVEPCAGIAARDGVLFVGRFASEPGLPDEAALDRLLDEHDGPVSVVGVDAAPLRRALSDRLAHVYGPDELDLALRRCRVAVVRSSAGPLAAELTGTAVPSVALDEVDALERVRRLAMDDDLWEVASVAQAARARTIHDPARRHMELVEVLAAAGIALDRAAAAPLPSVGAYRAPSRAGTLAAVRQSHEHARRLAQPPPLLPWQHALYTNLDLSPDVAYRRWLAVHHDTDARRDVVAARVGRATVRPLISLVMPVHDTDPSVLRAAIESVRAQIYDRWELCVADDGSRRADTRGALDELAAGDERIRLARLDEPSGIVAATNAAIGLARGGYVAFVDHDDVLTPDALAHVVQLLDADPSLDVVYTDEDKLDARGLRVEPFCKPDWSPDLLLSCNYVTHLLVVRRSLLEAVGGLRAGFDGAQDYDLVLRLTEHTDRVGHVAAPVYSWRKSPGSTALDIGAKPAAHDASRRALSEALARRGIDATVDAGVDPTWHRVRRRIGHRPLVTVVVPTRDRLDLLAPCVAQLRATVRHEPLELLIVDNESSDPATLEYLEHVDARVIRYPHRFNYARQMNLAAAEANGEVLLLLNNDVRPANDDWFDALLEHALRPEVGAVGARLRFPDGRPQHEGIVLNAAGVALNLDSGSWAVLGENIRNVSAVTGACLMVRSSVWHAVGGMDERLRVAYNDVDLCLRIGERGWRIVYTPYAELIHAESSSRGSLHPEVDESFFQRRWGPPRSSADPFFTTAIELLRPFSPRL